MTENYRLLAVDVDGTLMDSRNCLPERNRLALRRAHEAGLTVCLCTGRCLAETRAVLDELGLESDAGVFVFGAIVSSLPDGRTVQRTAISEATAGRLVAHFQALGYPVLLLYDSDETGFDYLLVEGERNRAAYERWLGLTPARWRQAGDWAPRPWLPVRIGIIDEPGQVQRTLDALRDGFPAAELKVNAIYAPNYGLHVVECFAPQVNKWHGVRQVARRLGLTDAQVVAIGDDVNDLEMVRHAGLGIAMGNAIPAVRACAGWQAPGHDACGVAAAVEALLTGELSRRFQN